MSWDFVTNLVNEIQKRSTVLTKVWLSVLVVFRILVVVVAAETVYSDEQDNFACNTLQPGCPNVCYDDFAPLSQVRYWIFHIISVFIPSAFYATFIMHRTGNEDEKKESEDLKNLDEEDACKTEGRRHIREAGFMKAYVIHIVTRTILEGFFLAFQ
uniref:gap junction gamma-1 protein-like n=1 Tax=Myxine glutinosa TaxID=7769 RepID=UPI00358E01F1